MTFLLISLALAAPPSNTPAPPPNASTNNLANVLGLPVVVFDDKGRPTVNGQRISTEYLRTLAQAYAVTSDARTRETAIALNGAVAMLDAEARRVVIIKDAETRATIAMSEATGGLAIAGACADALRVGATAVLNQVGEDSSLAVEIDADGVCRVVRGKAAVAMYVSEALDTATYSPYAGYGSAFYGVDPNADAALRHLAVVDEIYDTQVPMMDPSPPRANQTAKPPVDGAALARLEAAKAKNK